MSRCTFSTLWLVSVSSQSTLVNPEDFFDEFNVGIHEIDDDDVADAPTFPVIAREIHRRIAGRIVVAHTGFDKSSLSRTYLKHGLTMPDCRWLDSARVARRAWSQFQQRGYGLANLAQWCGIAFSHHDACEDARAAGLVLVKAINDTGVPLNEWFERLRVGSEQRR